MVGNQPFENTMEGVQRRLASMVAVDKNGLRPLAHDDFKRSEIHLERRLTSQGRNKNKQKKKEGWWEKIFATAASTAGQYLQEMNEDETEIAGYCDALARVGEELQQTPQNMKFPWRSQERKATLRKHFDYRMVEIAIDPDDYTCLWQNHLWPEIDDDEAELCKQLTCAHEEDVNPEETPFPVWLASIISPLSGAPRSPSLQGFLQDVAKTKMGIPKALKKAITDLDDFAAFSQETDYIVSEKLAQITSDDIIKNFADMCASENYAKVLLNKAKKPRRNGNNKRKRRRGKKQPPQEQFYKRVVSNVEKVIDDAKTFVDSNAKHKLMLILRGPPGSGQQSFVDECLRELAGTAVCSADAYFTDKNGKYEFVAEEIEQAHRQSQKTCRQACEKNKQLVVIQNTNIKRQDYAVYEEIAKGKGYKVWIIGFRYVCDGAVKDSYYYPIPTSAEQALMLQARDKRGVPLQTIERYVENYERDESHQVYTIPIDFGWWNMVFTKAAAITQEELSIINTDDAEIKQYSDALVKIGALMGTADFDVKFETVSLPLRVFLNVQMAHLEYDSKEVTLPHGKEESDLPTLKEDYSALCNTWIEPLIESWMRLNYDFGLPSDRDTLAISGIVATNESASFRHFLDLIYGNTSTPDDLKTAISTWLAMPEPKIIRYRSLDYVMSNEIAEFTRKDIVLTLANMYAEKKFTKN